MKDLLEPFRSLSKPAFILAAVLFVPLALILGFLATMDLEQYSLLVVSLDSAVRTLLFFGVLALFYRVLEDSVWVARIGALLSIFGTIGALIFAIGAFGEYIDAMGRPSWIGILIPLMLSGFIGTLLAGVATLRSDKLSNLISYLLFAPTIIFVLQFALMPMFPTWTVLLFVGAQAMVALILGINLPSEDVESGIESQRQPSAA